MKTLLARFIPKSLLNALQRLKLSLKLMRPYSRTPFSLADLLAPDFRSGYADREEKGSPGFRKIMAKLESYGAAGPIGPNKYWEYPWIMRNLDLKPGLKVLDAGCGRAPLQFLLAELGMETHGIDPNENVGWHGIDRRLMAKFGVSVEYKVEGMEALSYPDGYFDRVMSVSVLEHVRSVPVKDELATPHGEHDRALQARMIREMARVLKKGGLLLLTLDVIFPEHGAVLECNIDVAALVRASGLTMVGAVHEGVYGEPDFDLNRVRRRKGLELQTYTGVTGTSLGLIFRK